MKQLTRYCLILLLLITGSFNLMAGEGNESPKCSPEAAVQGATAAHLQFPDPASYFSLTVLAPPYEEIVMEETEEVRYSNKKFLDSSHLDVRLLYALTPVCGIHPSGPASTPSLLPPQESLHLLFSVLRV